MRRRMSLGRGIAAWALPCAQVQRREVDVESSERKCAGAGRTASRGPLQSLSQTRVSAAMVEEKRALGLHRRRHPNGQAQHGRARPEREMEGGPWVQGSIPDWFVEIKAHRRFLGSGP